MNESDRADLKAAARILTSQGELSVKEADRIAATLIRVAGATTPKQEAVTAAVVASPDDALLIDNLFRATLGLYAPAINDARMALRRRFNELRSTIPRVADHLEDEGKAAEAESNKCLPDGFMFDAYGNQRKRFIRVLFDGTTCVVSNDAEAQEYRLNDPQGDYQFKDVYLSQEEFDGLPEFDGF